MASKNQQTPKEGDETIKGSAPFRKVYYLMWEDRQVRRLSHLEKNVWFCCLTGSHTTMLPGLASVSVMRIADQVGATVASTNKALKAIEALGWIEFDRNMEVLRVVNAFKYNVPSNGDMVRGWMREWLRIPDCELRSKHLLAFKLVIAGSPSLVAIADEEIALGRFENRDKIRTYKRAAAEKPTDAQDTVSTPSQDGPETVSTSVSSKQEEGSSNASSLPTVETRVELPSPTPAGAGAGTGPVRPSFADESQTTPQPAAAPARPTPAVDATGQASLLPATGKPDRRRKRPEEPEDEPKASADLDRYVARWNELKKPRFPLTLTQADRIMFFQQRKARGVEELLWVLETLHGDAWSAHSTVRQLLSAEAAQKAAGLGAKLKKDAGPQPSKHITGRDLEGLWEGEA